MVKLTYKLIQILDNRSDSFSGEEIKMITEAIAISEGIPEKVEIDIHAKNPQQIMKDWLGE